MNTITFDRISVVSVSLKKDSAGATSLVNLRVADSKYSSDTAREKAKSEGKETDNFFTLNIWKPEIEKFNEQHKDDGQRLENLVPGTRIKVTGQLVNNNYTSNGTTVYKDVVTVKSVEVLYVPKKKTESEAPKAETTTVEEKPEENTKKEEPVENTQPEQEVAAPEVTEPSQKENPFEPDEDDEEDLPF